MQKLYIRLRDGSPVDHPILASNFVQAFPGVNLAAPGPDFAPFVRVAKPAIRLYEVCEGCTYEWDGDVVTDVWHVRPMTAEEKAAKIDELQQYQPYPSWVFDETTGSFEPPMPRPEGGPYQWDESQLAWVEIDPT